jgi:hypothetical protein
MRFLIVRLIGTATMFAVLTLVTGTADAATKKTTLPLISATDAKSLKAYVGREVAVVGTVVGAGRGTNDGLRFLDFSTSESRGFVAAIVPAVYPKLKPLEGYIGQVLRVTGTLETYKKKTQIKVTRISQIKVLPPPAPGAQKKKA